MRGPSDMTAVDIITLLGLSPHPEGGFYRETFRDAARDAADRARSTAIYFLLQAGQRSDWHRVDATECWLFHRGSPLLLSHAAAGGPVTTIRLGNDLIAGERPQAVVPAGHWQMAECVGEYALVTCVVAPGFSFAGFELAPPGFCP
ncbi:MAG: cupin domain-containing protein [Hyphomicrobiaceae bacterium]|nr:cupin domain-containing protein [Hyphomicrobiaceae bacterium]